MSRWRRLGCAIAVTAALWCAAGGLAVGEEPAVLALGAAEALATPSCATGECHAALQGLPVVHAPVGSGECLSCHRQTSAVHPDPSTAGFVLRYQVPGLCVQCHDQAQSPASVHKPYADGACGTCHEVHGGPAPALLKLSGSDQRELCDTCHQVSGFDQPFIHGPAVVGACTECHAAHTADQPRLLRLAEPKLCFRCHRDFGASLYAADVVHPPVGERACTSCHQPHGARTGALLNQSSPEICLECHEALATTLKKARQRHSPVTSGDKCATCHAVHYSDQAKLLVTTEQALCLAPACHGSGDAKKRGSPRGLEVQLEGKEFLHGPLQEGVCSPCHEPHGADHHTLLRGPYPETFYTPFRKGAYDFCLLCHDQNLLRFPDTSLYTNFRNGKQNLHYVHVADRRKGRTCRACHEAHAADGPMLITRDGSSFGDWRIPITFVKTDTGGSCTPGCHRNYRYDRVEPVEYVAPEDLR